MANYGANMFAIMRANNDVIFFDAITQLTEKYSASVSKHPMASGAFVTDHTTFDNPRFTVSGILSDADFNLSRPFISDAVNRKDYINNTQTVYPVTITEQSSLNKFLPEVIAQFTRDSIPDAFVTPQNKIKTARAVKDELVRMITSREEFTFFEYDGGAIPNSWTNCVFTGVDFKEDETTGEGIFPNLEFEQVSYAVIQNINVKIRSKGKQNGKSTTTPAKANPANAPSSYTGKSATDYRASGSNE
ncbi:phage baseplate protein [Pseudomonas sp. 8 R 14]|uniref:phage baseplate protein n=1 Tax=Pseudomonas sp. 8 R 14 TaxID=1844092 RepID=UPI00081240EE|nr:hypothetical protein [Pseudomonas sp. 8 R 14]CRM24013.1 hypothetical protein [Pseudomonas sp. 8 R 14]